MKRDELYVGFCLLIQLVLYLWVIYIFGRDKEIMDALDSLAYFLYMAFFIPWLDIPLAVSGKIIARLLGVEIGCMKVATMLSMAVCLVLWLICVSYNSGVYIYTISYLDHTPLLPAVCSTIHLGTNIILSKLDK